MMCGWYPRRPITCSVVVVVLLAGAGCGPARRDEGPKAEDEGGAASAPAIRVSAPEADDSQSADPPRSSSSMPDIVAMVKAEKPVDVEETPVAAGEEYAEIRLREQQGDREEAARLYLEYADAHRGTPGAAAALFRIAYELAPRHRSQSPEPSSFEAVGRIALRMAEENPSHPLTVRTLDMFATEFLRYGQAVKTTPENWTRVCRAAAILAGRYPKDVRGPRRLGELAYALALADESKPRAMEVYRLLSEWPHEAWDSRLKAYKALHDEALARGKNAEAQEIALRAANECAGKTFIDCYARPEKPGRGKDTPWERTMDGGLVSSGDVLLSPPRWNTGDRYFYEIKSEAYDRRLKQWNERSLRSYRPGGRRPEAYAVYVLGRAPGGMCYAVSNAGHAASGSPGSSRGGRAFATSSFAFPGEAGREGPRPQSLMFMPRFPVREGVSLVPFEWIGLVRQEAREHEGKIVVTIEAPRTLWKQTWSEGEPWWDEASVEYESSDYRGAWCPSPYDVDPGWGMRRHRLRAVRTKDLGDAVPPSAAEIEKSALKGYRHRPPNDEIAAFLLERAEKHFSGEALAILQAQLLGKPYRRGGRDERAKADKPEPVTKPRAADRRFAGFVLRTLWHPPEKEKARWPNKVLIDRGCLHVMGLNNWHWRVSADGELLESARWSGRAEMVRVDYRGTGRVEIGLAGETTFVREADRIVALDSQGREVWRHQVRTDLPAEGNRRHGLPFLADPRLVRVEDRDLIVCGVGHRTVGIGMGVWYSPLGGGILALNTQGEKVYGNQLGYCEELELLERPGQSPVIVAILVRVSYVGNRYRPEESPFLSAFDALTGQELWRADLPSEKDRSLLRRFGTRRLFIAEERGRQPFVVVNAERATIFALDGTKIGQAEGVWAAGLSDLDSDGKAEIIGYRSKRTHDRGGQLVVTDLNGKTLWTGPKGRWQYQGAEDLDNDGWKELLAIREGVCRAVAVFGRAPEER